MRAEMGWWCDCTFWWNNKNTHTHTLFDTHVSPKSCLQESLENDQVQGYDLESESPIFAQIDRASLTQTRSIMAPPCPLAHIHALSHHWSDCTSALIQPHHPAFAVFQCDCFVTHQNIINPIPTLGPWVKVQDFTSTTVPPMLQPVLYPPLSPWSCSLPSIWIWIPQVPTKHWHSWS